MRKQLKLRGKDMRNDAQLDQHELLDMVIKHGVEHTRLDIGMADDILIYNTIGITPKGYVKPYRYIIIRHTYATTWTNNVDIIFTDDVKAAALFEYDVMHQLEQEEGYY